MTDAVVPGLERFSIPARTLDETYDVVERRSLVKARGKALRARCPVPNVHKPRVTVTQPRKLSGYSRRGSKG
jgi:hypothetical protein